MSDYLGGSKDYFIIFLCGVRCVKSDWIRSEERLRCPDRESQIFNMLNIYDQKSCCVGGDTEDKHMIDLQIIKQYKTKQYPIRKRSDRRRKHNKP